MDWWTLKWVKGLRYKVYLNKSTAVVERSNSSCFRIISWMRKVVGSNLGDNLYRMYVFLLLWTSIEKRRLLRDRE